MSRRAMVWAGGFVALFVLLLLAWFGARWLGATGGDLPIVRAVLIALSAVLVAGVVWYLLSQSPALPPPPPAAGDDVAALLATAEQQLARAKIGKQRGLGELPLVIVLGRPGSGKSTCVEQSGLELDLLAGDVYRGNEKVPVPTSTLNAWYARGAGVIEVGWPLVTDGPRWQRLVERLQPKRLAAAFLQGQQAPRVVLACVSAEDLVAPDAHERVQGLVRELRAPVAALADAFGVALPVYVLVTKADRITGFREYVRPFTHEETRDVVGATLPIEMRDHGGSWAEHTSGRIDGALTMLYSGLVSRRGLVLDRHPAAEQKPLAYEFPREWRKLSPALSQLLVELCRPNQLTVNPFLRGFYVAGIRPSANQGAGSAPVQVAVNRQAASATMVVGGLQRARAAVVESGDRWSVEWAFLSRIFGEVILADHTAFGVTRAGTRLDALRRVLLGVTASLLLMLAVALTVSFASNRGLVNTVARHRAALAAMPRDAASLPALQHLDSLRATTDTLGQWVRTGAPLPYRFGLFLGARLYPEARQLYFAELRAKLYEQARVSLLERLRAGKGEPVDGFAFDTTYGLLKAHLVTTSHPDSSTGAFLGPILTRRWDARRRADAAQLALAQRQFAFLGDELPRGNPYADAVDMPAVQQSRTYLLQLPVEDRIYQFIKTRANQVAQPVSFARAFPESRGALRAPHEVPGAFTRDGRAVVDQALANIDQYLVTEPWVLGADAPGVPNKAILVDRLRERYRRDVASEWRQVLASASVIGFGRAGAMRRLQELAGNQSAILAVLSLVARNTAGDSVYLEKAFQPVRVVATADSLSPGAPTSVEYLSALARLGADIEAVSKSKGAEQMMAAKSAEGSVSSARLAALAVSQKMQVDAEGGIDRRIYNLLLQPINFASATLSGAGTAELDGAGSAMCAAFNRLSGKFPFSPTSRNDATVAELNEMIKPGSGRLWKLYQERLSSVITRTGDGTFVAQSGGAIQISPAFMDFLTQMGRIADGLYPNGASDPRIDFSVSINAFNKSSTQVLFGVDGRVQRFSVASASESTGEFTWSLQSARQAQLQADVVPGGLDITESGPWGLFRLFFSASMWSGRGARTMVEWNTNSQGRPLLEPLRVQLSLPDAPNIFRRDFYSGGIRCVGRVAQ